MWYCKHCGLDAADEFEVCGGCYRHENAALRSEVERLRLDCEAWKAETAKWEKANTRINADSSILKARAERLERALREVEWHGDVVQEDGTRYDVCPWCRKTEEDGHAPDCTRQQALRGEE